MFTFMREKGILADSVTFYMLYKCILLGIIIFVILKQKNSEGPL